MTTIRPARPADLPRLRTVCALAYDDNPLMRWVLPDDALRVAACAAWLGPSLERYVAAGHVDVLTADDEVVAVAAWRLPGTAVASSGAGAGPGAGTGAGAPPPPRPAAVLGALVGDERATQVLGALAGSTALAPASAGPYLNYLAVLPTQQGRGSGGRLLRHGLETLAGVVGTPWLATTDPRNVPFYERHGFTTAGTHRLGDDGPRLAVLHLDAGGTPRGPSGA
ncbi:GNAT family N-acetyltransferase [Cellulomonas sp. S1-8]|uniref:GNAT family N-acetyltransferase n=1 Tax=Cellulomonas sp. S1-8 TaxID=2904790 RepID=UPI002243A8D2|nr:GNAT family N-acetyltransferase [Cellulomonas sp. S1-8]UZN01856.1 GNAT family N-acetyltransferase [Cellulomonas sp. S1-8]